MESSINNGFLQASLVNDLKSNNKKSTSSDLYFNNQNHSEESEIILNLSSLDKEVKRIKDLMVECEDKYKYGKSLPLKSQKALDEIEKKHNTSWGVFMYEHNKESNAMNKTAILYRGHKISYAEMWSKVFQYCKSLKAMGVKKGDQIPVCINNIPEYVYLFIASSLVGAKLHIIGDWFDDEFLLETINKTNSNIMFMSEDKYALIKDVVEKSNIKSCVLASLSDSLPKDKNGNSYNPFSEIDGLQHDFSSHIEDYKKDSSKVLCSQKEFLAHGVSYEGDVLEETTLNDIATYSYTSGTTGKGHPKGVKHNNRAIISSSRFKQADVSNFPEMKDLVAQYNVPVYSFTNLNNVADTLYCNCTYACEPFNELDFHLYSLKINKTNYFQTPLGAGMYMAKKLDEPMNKNVKLRDLIMFDIVGEECSTGEEKYLNKISRKHSFGTAKLPFPLSPVTTSFGGGSCESGGIFTTLYHSLQEKVLAIFGKKYSLGLIPMTIAEYKFVNENGEECGYNEPGFLVTRSAAEMVGYIEDELNEDAYFYDADGTRWIKAGAIGYKADPIFKSVKLKGRENDYTYLSNGELFPTYKIAEAISSDTKNIMSCTVIKNLDSSYVCHIEKQPDSKKSIDYIINSCSSRLSKNIPEEILSKIYFRIHSNEEGFPISHSGKRNITLLKSEDNKDILIPLISDKKLEKESGKKRVLFRK